MSNGCKHCGCLMQLTDEECPDCFALDNNFEAICQLCGLFENLGATCVKCKRKVCASCSLPAVTIDAQGKLHDAVNNEVLCWKCSSPGFGPHAKYRRHPRGPGPGKRKERNE